MQEAGTPASEVAGGEPIFMSRVWHDTQLKEKLKRELAELRAQQKDLKALYQRMLKRTSANQKPDLSDDELSQVLPTPPGMGWSTRRTAGSVYSSRRPYRFHGCPMAGVGIAYSGLAVGSAEFTGAALIFGKRSTS